MEKRVLIAALLSAVFLAWYSQLVTKRYAPARSPESGSGEVTQRRDPGGQAAPEPVMMQASRTSIYPLDKEEVVVIDSVDLAVEIGVSSGAVRRVTLKEFMDGSGEEPLQIANGLQLLALRLDEAPYSWSLVNRTSKQVTLGTTAPDGNSYHISYTLDDGNPIVKLMLSKIKSLGKSPGNIVLSSSWARSDELEGRRNPLESMMLMLKDNGKEKHKRYYAPFKQTKNVPRGTAMVSLAERYFCQSIRPEIGMMATTLLPSPEGTVAVESRIETAQLPGGLSQYTLSAYFGPRDYFRLKQAGFEGAFPIGILGQIGLILLSMLNVIAGLTGNYGLAIIIFSGIISCLMAPFTLISFKSMKKMSELKPQIDQLMAQHKDDPQKANQQVFALYKTHKVSPLSGCLPMLLQMPIFIAMFQAISHFIELRGQSFLWIQDLSLPDRVAELPFSIPLLGSDLNLLPIIMAVVMYVQTKMSQGKMAKDQNNPAAKLMSGPFMSIFFGFLFYSFPSGLVLYWLTNSVVSLIWYKTVR